MLDERRRAWRGRLPSGSTEPRSPSPRPAALACSIGAARARIHDPTTRDRQGTSIGPQYRSVIFYHNDKQRELAEHYKAKLDASHVFSEPIVTEISKFTEFYPADKSHQGFFRLNPGDEYCRPVIQPKVAEFEKVFGEKVKPSQAPATRQQ